MQPRSGEAWPSSPHSARDRIDKDLLVHKVNEANRHQAFSDPLVSDPVVDLGIRCPRHPGLIGSHGSIFHGHKRMQVHFFSQAQTPDTLSGNSWRHCPLWCIYGHITHSPSRSAGVLLKESAPFLSEAWLPGPKLLSRLVSICLGQSLRTKGTILVVFTNKRCALRAGTEVGKRLSRSSKRQFSRDNYARKSQPPAWATVSAYVLGTGLKAANNTFPCFCARSGGGARFCMLS